MSADATATSFVMRVTYYCPETKEQVEADFEPGDLEDETTDGYYTPPKLVTIMDCPSCKQMHDIRL